MQKLILIGAGGYAKSVLDSVDYYNYEIAGFIDQYCNESEHLGYPIIAKEIEEIKNKEKYFYFIAIGNNKRRKIWFDKLKSLKLHTINVVDRSAIVSGRAEVGTGCFIGKMAIINSKATIGNNCIINTKALIEHGCTISDHVNLSTNSVLNGDVKIGTGSFIGSSSVTLGQISIGEWSTIGAGAVVTKTIGDNVTAVGVPAKILKQGAMLG